VWIFLDVNWGSSTQAQTYKTALASVQKLDNVNEHVKNYRPQILVLTGKPQDRPPLVDLTKLITKNNALMMCGHVVQVNWSPRLPFVMGRIRLLMMMMMMMMIMIMMMMMMIMIIIIKFLLFWNNSHKANYRGADKSLARPDWKNNWKIAIFRRTRSLLPRRPDWTDNFLNCFWVACKSSSLVAVACFLPGRAKDLSAPPYSDSTGK